MNRPWVGIVMLAGAAALFYSLLTSTRFLKLKPKSGGTIGAGLLQAKVCDASFDCQIKAYPDAGPFGSLGQIAHKLMMVGAGVFGLAALLSLLGWPSQMLRRAFPEVIMGLILLALTGVLIGKIMNDGGDLASLGLGFGLSAIGSVAGLVGGTLVASHFDISSGSKHGNDPDALARFEKKYGK